MLRNLFTWRGRIGRARFLGYSILPLPLFVIGLAPLALEVRAGNQGFGSLSIGTILLTIAVLVTISWINVVTPIKRLHDLNLSGWWWWLWILIPTLFTGSPSAVVNNVCFVLFIISLILIYCLPGTRGDNRFGPEPARYPALPTAVEDRILAMSSGTSRQTR